MSAPGLIWHAAGEPPHKYAEEVHHGVCATCGADISEGVQTEQVNNPTFANHAEFFKFGTHVCRACAWLYGDPKRTHRNVLAVGDELFWPMISADSATDERPSWMDLLSRLSDYPTDTPMTGVLTSDPKPRMWPRCRLTTVGAPGLYVHAPLYDVSEYRMLNLEKLQLCLRPIRDAMNRGFKKQRKTSFGDRPGPIFTGLIRDYKNVRSNVSGVLALERELVAVRGSPEFVPALLVAQVSKEEKQKTKEKQEYGESEDRGSGTGLSGGADGGREACGEAREDECRLF